MSTERSQDVLTESYLTDKTLLAKGPNVLEGVSVPRDEHCCRGRSLPTIWARVRSAPTAKHRSLGSFFCCSVQLLLQTALQAPEAGPGHQEEQERGC